MKIRCHCCDKIVAVIRDASIAKGTVMICKPCASGFNTTHEKRGDITDFRHGFMSDFFRGLRK